MIPHNIPINGRIAIVDDQISQALPLMKLFGRLQIPYVYYDSDRRNLPEEDSAYNDVRILFLDINLLDNSKRKDAVLKSVLVAVLNRIISNKNYPYLLIYWSRHENEYDEIVREIFTDILPAKAPINFLSLRKSDYINDDGSLTDSYESNEPQLFEKIKTELGKFPVYEHLMNWENIVHLAADKTLEEIFKLKNYGDDWSNEADYIFYKLALAYSGKTLNDSAATEQVKSAFFSLNYILGDNLENTFVTELNNYNDISPLYKESLGNQDLLKLLNKKLLFSDELTDKYLPGIIYETGESVEDAHNILPDYDNILNNWIDREKYCLSVEKDIKLAIKGKRGKERKKSESKAKDKELKKFRSEIRKDWKKIEINITPTCDYIQGKCIYFRLIRGLLINSKHRKFFNQLSEATHISPDFVLPETVNSYFLLLDFRFFNTILRDRFHEGMKPILRTRQQLLSDIQSKLSRHTNRQGILFLE